MKTMSLYNSFYYKSMLYLFFLLIKTLKVINLNLYLSRIVKVEIFIKNNLQKKVDIFFLKSF